MRKSERNGALRRSWCALCIDVAGTPRVYRWPSSSVTVRTGPHRVATDGASFPAASGSLYRQGHEKNVRRRSTAGSGFDLVHGAKTDIHHSADVVLDLEAFQKGNHATWRHRVPCAGTTWSETMSRS